MTTGGVKSDAARRKATAIGGSAIVIWSTLAILATLSGPVPPFQLVAMAFLIAALVGTVVAAALGKPLLAALRQSPKAWLTGVGGLFGYHVLYFAAMRLAPNAAVEVNLLNYLWPLLIVVFSGLLPGERLRRGHLWGCGLGLAGTALIVVGGRGLTLEAGALPGYLCAAAAAVTWAGYSVLSRRFGDVPTETVTGFCLATAILAALCHGALEPTIWPQGAEWIAVFAIGLGPVGGAFYVWDHGVKRGDIQALGVLSYATPFLSTLLLVLVGGRAASWSVWGGGVLIIGAALLASGTTFTRR